MNNIVKLGIAVAIGYYIGQQQGKNFILPEPTESGVTTGATGVDKASYLPPNTNLPAGSSIGGMDAQVRRFARQTA